MKIIQLVVVDDNCVQGLGDDGKLYELTWRTATFGRKIKEWLLYEGCPTLAQNTADILRYAQKHDIEGRIKRFAATINAQLSREELTSANIVHYKLAVGSEFVLIAIKAESATISGSDNSAVSLNLVGKQYV